MNPYFQNAIYCLQDSKDPRVEPIIKLIERLEQTLEQKPKVATPVEITESSEDKKKRSILLLNGVGTPLFLTPAKLAPLMQLKLSSVEKYVTIGYLRAYQVRALGTMLVQVSSAISFLNKKEVLKELDTQAHIEMLLAEFAKCDIKGTTDLNTLVAITSAGISSIRLWDEEFKFITKKGTPGNSSQIDVTKFVSMLVSKVITPTR